MTDSSTTVSEQTTEITLRVNGVNRTASAPARRLLSDFLRHDLRLTGTHVGCEHGVCGACTVLVDGAADALVPDVRRHRPGPRDHHRRGPAAPDAEQMSPVQQAFTECHGLQCGFCTPGFLTTITAYLRGEPGPDAGGGPRVHLGQPLPLHRLPEHRQVGPARRRDRAKEREADVMTTKMFGAPVQRKEDPRLLTGNGRYLDDLGHDALAAAFVRSPHAHARILDIDVDRRARRRGRHRRSTRTRTWTGQVAEPPAAADPAPDADPPAAPATAWRPTMVNHVGEPVVMVVATDRYVAEDACERIRVDYEQLPVVVGHRGGPRRRRARARRTCPATSPRTWCRRSATPTPRSPPPRTR